MLNKLKPGLKMTLSSENETHDKKKRRAKSNKGCRGNKKKQRESEQLNIDPEQVIEEEEKRQPHSVEDE
jgi:hypothetical protein